MFVKRMFHFAAKKYALWLQARVLIDRDELEVQTSDQQATKKRFEKLIPKSKYTIILG